jgi:LysR family transcriptional regulator, transcription activator of glutamate synthase operon
MNFQHLEYFNELAETQYMAQAAEKLGISQPTLSYAVKKLEEKASDCACPA